MVEGSGKKGDKKEALKRLIRALHQGLSPEEARAKFKDLVKDVDAKEIAQIEEELVREGMPRDEVRRLCDVHLAVFQETMGKEKTLAPQGHPIYILMEEHKMLLEFAEGLKGIAGKIKVAKAFASVGEEMEKVSHMAEHFKESESHYSREENVLFPYLEKHGVTEPPAIMWMEHDKIREIKKNLYGLLEGRQGMAFGDFGEKLEEVASSLASMLSSHFHKENNILFPTGLKVIEEDEWKEIRRQFDEMGYCCFTPEPATMVVGAVSAGVAEPKEVKGAVAFETGGLSKEELETILNTLPVDITFVDAHNTVRYFSQSKERIFPRTKAVIGRTVQQCHPEKSLHVVNQILEDFKGGKRDAAEFWINLKGRLVYIRYFAVRGNKGKYLGCLEVTQDITGIKKIKGEKRLL